MSKVVLVESPIEDAKQLRKLVIDEDGGVKFRVAIELGEIIDADLEGFNDLVGEKLSDKWGHGLNDISYTVVGAQPDKDDGICSGRVIVEVDSGFDWDVVDEDWGDD